MSWVKRSTGKTTAHFLDGYDYMVQSYSCSQEGDSGMLTTLCRGVADDVGVQPGEPHLWLIEAQEYHGLYRAIHRERAEDPHRNENRALLIVHSALENCDDKIWSMLYTRQLTLKDIHFYSKYEEFLDDVLIMLDDILRAYKVGPRVVNDRLTEAGFSAAECSRLFTGTV